MSQSENASSSSSIQPSNPSTTIYLSSQLNTSSDFKMHNYDSTSSSSSIYKEYTMSNYGNSREKLRSASKTTNINSPDKKQTSKKKLEHQAKSCFTHEAHRKPVCKQKTIEFDSDMRDYTIDSQDKRDSIKSVTGNKFVLNDKDLIEFITLRTSNIAIVINSSSNLTINDIDKSSNELDQLTESNNNYNNGEKKSQRQFLDVCDAKRRKAQKNYTYCASSNLRNYKKNSSLTRSHSNNSIDLLNTSLSSLILKNPPSCKFNPSFNESVRMTRKKAPNETDDDDIIEPTSNCVSYLVRNNKIKLQLI